MRAKKCPFLSPYLECNVGGFGSLACHEPAFHDRCEHKKPHAHRLAENEEYINLHSFFERARHPAEIDMSLLDREEKTFDVSSIDKHDERLSAELAIQKFMKEKF